MNTAEEAPIEGDKMKRHGYLIAAILFFCILAAALKASAETATLEWDANATQPDGYRIYAQTTTTGEYAKPPVWEGPGTVNTCTIEFAEPEQVRFVATAFIRGGLDGRIIESEYSNEVIWTPTSMKPEAPKGLRLIIEKIIGWIKNGNWKS